MIGLARFCEVVVLTGLSLAAQSTFLLGVGLLAGQLGRRRGPVWQALVYRATLASVAAGALCFMSLAPHWRPLWRVTLPPASSAPVLVPGNGYGETGPGNRDGDRPVPAGVGPLAFASAWRSHSGDEMGSAASKAKPSREHRGALNPHSPGRRQETRLRPKPAVSEPG